MEKRDKFITHTKQTNKSQLNISSDPKAIWCPAIWLVDWQQNLKGFPLLKPNGRRCGTLQEGPQSSLAVTRFIFCLRSEWQRSEVKPAFTLFDTAVQKKDPQLVKLVSTTLNVFQNTQVYSLKFPQSSHETELFMTSLVHMCWERETNCRFLLLAVADLESCQNTINA